MKKLKHSKYKNTGILFEMLVRKLTSETLSSNKIVTVDIIKKYFGKNTELSKELQLYNALLKENFKSEAQALDYIRTVKSTHDKLNQTVLKRQRYNLVKEISDRFNFDDISKIHINNYKTLASIYMIFEYQETDNPKQLLECKNVILENALITSKVKSVQKDPVIENFESHKDDSNYVEASLHRIPNSWIILSVLIGIGTAYLAYSCNYNETPATRFIVTLFAFFFSGIYLVYYFIIYILLNKKCNGKDIGEIMKIIRKYR